MEVGGAPHDLESVFRSDRVRLVRLALLLSGSREVAEDAVQSALVGLVSHHESVRDPSAYLRRAVVNRVKDTQRRSYRVARRWSPPVVTEIPELDETWHEIRRLPHRQRQVVVLHFYEDLSLVEIAEMLGVPAGTVRSDLHRAFAALKRRLT